MAGVYKEVVGAIAPVFTILTVDASESIAPIHYRMPVIWGSRAAQTAWIEGNIPLKDLIHDHAVQEIEFQSAV